MARGPGRVGEQRVDPLGDARLERGRVGGPSTPPPAGSKGTSSPVPPSTTTSGMPPTAVATTAVPQAIASRFTMPSGS